MSGRAKRSERPLPPPASSLYMSTPGRSVANACADSRERENSALRARDGVAWTAGYDLLALPSTFEFEGRAEAYEMLFANEDACCEKLHQ